MTIISWLVIILTTLVIVLFLLWRRSVKLLKAIKFTKVSLSTKYGKMTEQFMPFLANYPHDPHRFRFIGTPIDGLQFEDDRIVFVEFKTHTSRPTATQQQIRQLVENKKVIWEEYRLS